MSALVEVSSDMNHSIKADNNGPCLRCVCSQKIRNASEVSVRMLTLIERVELGTVSATTREYTERHFLGGKAV